MATKDKKPVVSDEIGHTSEEQAAEMQAQGPAETAETTKAKPAKVQVSVLAEFVPAVRDLTADIEAANKKVGRDLARVKADSAIAKLKAAVLEITEAAALDA